ncbi:MAG: hypothetical protein ACR2JN_12765 [Lapillicoccus sp.]
MDIWVLLPIAALVAALLAAALIVRGEWRSATEHSPENAHPVPIGTWMRMNVGDSKRAVSAEVRVVSIRTYPQLTQTRRSGVTAKEGAKYAVVLIECRCPAGNDDLYPPPSLVVDQIGRRWDTETPFEDYVELGPVTGSARSGNGPRDGTTTWAKTAAVAADAAGLKAVLDRHDGNYLYGE